MFFRKDDPKPLNHIVNKRLRKYVSEIGELRFSIFHIPGANNFLSDRGSRFPTGKAGNDRGDDLGSASDLGSAKKVVAASAEIQANTMGSLPPTVLPKDAQSDYPNFVQIFAYGAHTPACDADVHDEESIDSGDYAAQSLLEVAAYLSISAEKRVSVAMTEDKLREEIQSDESYKYLWQTIVGNVRLDKFGGTGSL